MKHWGWMGGQRGFEQVYTLDELVGRIVHEVHIGAGETPTRALCGSKVFAREGHARRLERDEVLCGECRTLSMKLYGRLP